MTLTVEQVDSAILTAKTNHETGRKCSQKQRYMPVYRELNIDGVNHKKIREMKHKTHVEFPTIDEWVALGDCIKLVYGIYEGATN